jgi:hypothetical protein
MGPEFNEIWKTYFKDKPDKPVMFGSIVAGGKATVQPIGLNSTESLDASVRGPHFASSREVYHHVSLDDFPRREETDKVPTGSSTWSVLSWRRPKVLY